VLLQTIEAALEILANIISIILLFLMPIVVPIGQWMVGWISVVMDFIRLNFSSDYMIYIIICVILIVSGIIINVIWPGDKKGSILIKV